MAKAIVAIGGGEIRTRGTAGIDREIIRLSKKEHPSILFVPTASSDSERYRKHFLEYFGKFWKCKVDVLFLVNERPSAQQIERKILSADIIYVGGGNTLLMMRVLKTAYEDGIVLAGISAGAICWFDSGHSDSMSFYNPRNRNYINVKLDELIAAAPSRMREQKTEEREVAAMLSARSSDAFCNAGGYNEFKIGRASCRER